MGTPGVLNTSVQNNAYQSKAGNLPISVGEGTLPSDAATLKDVEALGGNTSDVTLAAVGSTPNANGASLAGQVLNLQPADASHPGVMVAADKAKLDKYSSVPGTRAIKSKSANYDASASDDLVLFSGAGDTHVNLPTAGLAVGQVITIKNVGSGTPINIFTSNAGEMNGNPQLYSVPGGATTGGYVSLVWDGSVWWKSGQI